jgi:hypothetical protein
MVDRRALPLSPLAWVPVELADRGGLSNGGRSIVGGASPMRRPFLVPSASRCRAVVLRKIVLRLTPSSLAVAVTLPALASSRRVMISRMCSRSVMASPS